VFGDLLAAHKTHHECGAHTVVIEVVATQVRNGGDHADLHGRDAGDVGGDGYRKRGQAADIGHETLGGGKAHMVIDDRGDRFVGRAGLPLQVACRCALRTGQSSVTVDGDFEYLAQRASGPLRGDEIRHRGNHGGDPPAHLLR
jgi:hypothetical protein